MFLKSISTLSDLIQLVLEYTFTLYTLYLFTLLAANRTVISNKLLFKKKHIRYNLYLINIVEPSFFINKLIIIHEENIFRRNSQVNHFLNQTIFKRSVQRFNVILICYCISLRL